LFFAVLDWILDELVFDVYGAADVMSVLLPKKATVFERKP